MSVDSAGMAARLGIKPGMVVQELGWDEDADEDLRDAIVDLSGGEMVDEDTDEVADVVILWWREDDGDLVDALVDAIASLADEGVVWLLVPQVRASGPCRARRRHRGGAHGGPVPDQQHLRGQGLVGHPPGDPEGGPLPPLRDDRGMTLSVGDAAPDFRLPDQDKQVVSLADLRGTPVLLVFYPFAFSRHLHR